MTLDLEKLSAIAEVLGQMDLEEIERIQKAADILIIAEHKLLTAKDVAVIMGGDTSEKTVANWYNKGILKGFKYGKEYRFTQEDVKEFQESVKGCTVTKAGDVFPQFKKQ